MAEAIVAPRTLGPAYRLVDRCRACGSDDLALVLSLGSTPLANSLVPAERLGDPEPRFPLEVQRCTRCGLVQLTVVVAAESMFRDYVYSSSASTPLVAHFAGQADEVVQRFAPPPALVVEVGSNDGILLRPLAARGAVVVGVEPAVGLARSANAEGLETWNEFFSNEVARRIVAEKGPAMAVVANNVLAHIDDLEDVLAGLDTLLDAEGVFIAEIPYLVDLLDHTEYDTIYHEHLAYFSIAPLRALFARGGLELFDARRLQIHGGSLRIYVGRAGRREATSRLRALADDEALALAGSAPYDLFAARVHASRVSLLDMLERLAAKGSSLAGYGATAKGNTLLNYCGIGPDLLAFIADTTPAKQGLYTPGMHIPVVPEEELLRKRPDHALLLAWNYADSILERRADYIAAGGRFIHPIPTARLLPE